MHPFCTAGRGKGEFSERCQEGGYVQTFHALERGRHIMRNVGAGTLPLARPARVPSLGRCIRVEHGLPLAPELFHDAADERGVAADERAVFVLIAEHGALLPAAQTERTASHGFAAPLDPRIIEVADAVGTPSGCCGHFIKDRFERSACGARPIRKVEQKRFLGLRPACVRPRHFDQFHHKSPR